MRRNLLVVAAVLSCLITGCTAGAAATTSDVGSSSEANRPTGASLSTTGAGAVPPTRNVILMIGDGLGDSEITMARNYAVGAAGRLAIDEFPHTAASTTFSVLRGTETPDYVTDSAAAASAWATGHRTYNGALSIDPVTSAPLPTILEKARDAGLRTGSVTTAALTDATPAALVAHLPSRGCQGPADMSGCPAAAGASGPGSIAEQSIHSGADILLGGGKAVFDQPVIAGGPRVLDEARQRGYRVVRDLDGLDDAPPGAPILGLFASGHLTPVWSGPTAQPYPGPAATRCTDPNPDVPAGQPRLADLTTAALTRLSAGDDPPGFFLQVEGALIDKQSHEADPCGQIGEIVEFDRAVRAARDWARDHPDTLIVVTGDHAQAVQILPQQTDSDHSPGAVSTLITADGQPMVVGYATNLPDRVMNHTGTQVPVLAAGPSADRIAGVLDETDLHSVLAQALGLPE